MLVGSSVSEGVALCVLASPGSWRVRTRRRPHVGQSARASPPDAMRAGRTTPAARSTTIGPGTTPAGPWSGARVVLLDRRKHPVRRSRRLSSIPRRRQSESADGRSSDRVVLGDACGRRYASAAAYGLSLRALPCRNCAAIARVRSPHGRSERASHSQRMLSPHRCPKAELRKRPQPCRRVMPTLRAESPSDALPSPAIDWPICCVRSRANTKGR